MMEADFVRDEMVVKCVPKASLFTKESLWTLSHELDCCDAVSLLYLMAEDRRANEKIYEKLSKADAPRKVFYEACCKYVRDWDRKIIEALVELGHFKVLLDVYRVNKLDAVFNVNESSDRVLNCNKLRIFKICEGLDQRHKTKFLKAMNESIVDYMPIKNYDYLEMYFMYWESVGEIDPHSGKGFDYLERAIQATGLNNLLEIIAPEGYQSPDSLTVDDYTLETYEILDENEVGLCVIVNQFDFMDPINNRAASVLDKDCLEKVMKCLKFKVIVLNNLKSSDFEPQIKKMITSHFKRKTHSILFLTIMSHGQEGQIMGTDGMYVPMKIISKVLYEANVLNKIPKVLVMCACRGDSIFTAHSRGYYESDSPLGGEKIRSDIVDLIVCYSTIPGFISIRNTTKGSLFMQVLCEVLKERPELEICEIFTMVNKALMNPKDFRLYNPAKIAHPCEFNSRLLKKLYFIKRS